MSSIPLPRRLAITPTADGATVALVDCAHLDESATQEVREELLRLIAPDEVKTVILSLAEVDYLTSTLLAILMMIHKRLRARAGKLVVCDVAPVVYEVFEVTRVTTLMEVLRQTPPEGSPTGGTPGF